MLLELKVRLMLRLDVETQYRCVVSSPKRNSFRTVPVPFVFAVPVTLLGVAFDHIRFSGTEPDLGRPVRVLPVPNLALSPLVLPIPSPKRSKLN